MNFFFLGLGARGGAKRSKGVFFLKCLEQMRMLADEFPVWGICVCV